MLRNKKLSRLLSLIAAFSVLFTAFAGINVSAKIQSVANKSFYENFEGYEGGDVSYTNYDNKTYQNWNVKGIANASKVSKLILSAADAGDAKGKSLNIGFEKSDTSAMSLMSIYKNPDMIIKNEDIIISADMYFPAVNTTDPKQVIRFYVSRGLSTAKVSPSSTWSKEYTPANDPAFGMFFASITGESKWGVSIVAPVSQNNANEYKAGAISNYRFTPETWHNISYVYKPSTGDVDYYIDGILLGSHPTGKDYNLSVGTGTYVLPDLGVGEALGNIFLATGGYQDAETAVMCDNISVVTASAASNVKYGDVKNGSDYIFANWDIPVDPATIKDANVIVKKMSTGDAMFSGAGATTVSGCTVDFKGANGVGIQFPSALMDAYSRYQVLVNGTTDVYGNEANYVYNCTVGESVPTVGPRATFSETFDSAITGWSSSDNNTKLLLSHAQSEGDKNGVLKAELKEAVYRTLSSPAFALPINTNTEYVDLDFDLKAIENNDTNEYEAYVTLVDGNGATPIGIMLNGTHIKPITSAGARIDNPNAANTGMLGEWKSYRLRYYPWDGEVKVYVGATQESLSSEPVLTTLTYSAHNNGNPREGVNPFTWDASTNGSEIKGIKIKTGKISDTYIDNVKATSYGYPETVTTVKAITFEDSNGAILAADKLVGAKNVRVHLDNAASAPAVTLATSENSVAFTPSFDPTSGIYTMDINPMILGGATYTLNVNDTNYTFTTGAGEFKVSNLRFVNDSNEAVSNPLDNGEVYAAVDVFNSNDETETPYLIWAAYNGTQLKAIGFDKIDAIGGFNETVKGEALNVTNDYTTVRAFIWDSLSTLKPLLKEVNLTKVN